MPGHSDPEGLAQGRVDGRDGQDLTEYTWAVGEGRGLPHKLHPARPSAGRRWDLR